METSKPLPIQEEKDTITFTDIIKKDLRVTSNWSTFISIFSLSMMLFSFFCYSYIIYLTYSLGQDSMSEILAQMPWEGYALLLFITGIFVLLILSFISLLLFSFEIKKAVNYENSDAMEYAIVLLLKFFKYNGILIVGIFLVGFLTYLYFNSFNI